MTTTGTAAGGARMDSMVHLYFTRLFSRPKPMMKLLTTASLAFFVASNVASQATQNIVYNTTLKKDASDACTWPFAGIQESRCQMIIPQSVLTSPAVPVVINDIFCQTHLVDLNQVNQDIEIRMGVTTVPYGQLSKTWATNNPNPTVVYRGPLNYNLRMNQWRPIGLPKSYFFFPKTAAENLCLEVIIHKTTNDPYGALGGCGSAYIHAENAGTTPTTLHQTNWECNWVTSQSTDAAWQRNAAPSLGFLLGNGNFVVSGLGGITSPPLKRLEISANTWPQPTKPMTISLSGAPNRASIIAFGFAFNPFDMATIGAPRSTIWFNPLIQVGMATNSSGIADLPFVVPAGLTTGTLFAQWYQIDPGAYANQLGLTTSNCATLIFGN